MQATNDKLIQGVIEHVYDNIVGQEAAKKQARFLIDSYNYTRIFPNMLFVAPKGNGKTTLGKATARGLVLFDENGNVVLKDGSSTDPKRKTYIEVNCATIKNAKQFFHGIIQLYKVCERDCTLLFDEASELPRDVTMALLTILNPNTEQRNSYSFEEMTFDFDFRRVTFLFATSEIQKVFAPLVDRLKRIDLEEYSSDQISEIVRRSCKKTDKLPEVDFENKDLLLDIAKVTRGNARKAQQMAEDIRVYLKGDAKFHAKQWTNFKSIFNIQPLGLSPLEITVLRYLAAHADGVSLTRLSAKTGMSKDSLQRDIELFLQKHDLMEIGTGGRKITAKGIAYLQDLDGVKRTVALPKIDVAPAAHPTHKKGKKPVAAAKTVTPVAVVTSRPKPSAPVGA